MHYEKDGCYGCSCLSLQVDIHNWRFETHELNFSLQLGKSRQLGKQRGTDCMGVHRELW